MPFYEQRVDGFLACRRPQLIAAVKRQHRLGAILVLGDPWGDGATGDAFAAKSLGPKEDLLTGISSTGSVLDSAVGGVVTMAKVFAVEEAGNRVSISPSGGDLGFAGHAGWSGW